MMKALPKRKIGSLECIEIPGNDNAPVIVIMHGYGADCLDLLPMARIIDAPPGTRFLFPNGPMAVPIGPHVTGRAWFEIDIEALEMARMEGTHRDLSKTTPKGMKEAREKIFEMLRVLQIPISKVIFCGFSQGAMMATQCALFAPENPKGLIIWSGALLDQNTWKEKALKHKGLAFYQSHGNFDDLLSVDGGQDLHKLLVDNGLSGRFETFDGAHEIPMEIVYSTNQYLKSILKA